MASADLLLHRFGRLGRPGALGGALLAAALAVELFAVRDTVTEADRLAAANARTRHAVRTAPRAAAPVAIPRSLAAEAVLAHLFGAADRAGLTLARGDYKLLAGDAGTGRRYQLSLPVRGRYPAIRVFLAAALDDNPALALNDLRMQRDAIESEDMEATLRFTLYLEDGA